ncbi:hypothetical protein CEP52_015711 [Fusarium oligoseptatum]|uniref:Fungal N-terminal domain-containing protein n=1 Tax=Fusarium oligoseptatum TaxID=2604345 RepID=A0A428SAH7_9HYPO|nr:hypothetical protein CEP52_015711 [Fusarium oligoseptatum]
MEAIGVGANVLAFVVLGIKSAKMAHETLSAIKDGPALVQSVAANFLQLHWILEQLLQCRAAASDPALHGQARQCCEDLDKLAKIIERLQVPPSEKATGKFWKRLKAAISENDLNRLDAWAAQQASMLSLRLNVLSSNVLYATRDGNERIQQQIHSFGTSMQTQFESQTASFLDAAKNMTSSHADGRSALEAGLSSIQETIKATHSISSEDTKSMFQLLQEIKGCVAPDSAGDSESTKAKGDDEQTTGGAAPSLNHKMLESINSLCSLIDEKRDAIEVYAEDDDQAESVIEDLQGLVKSLRGQKLPVSDPESFEKDLRRFGRSFGSNVLSINSRVGTPRRPVTQVLEQTQSFSEADVGAGKLSLRVQKRKRAVGTDDEDEDDMTERKRCYTDWMMTLAFLPGQAKDSVSSISQLQVNRVLPAGSLVFELVEAGDLQGLKEMLQSGRASLQDHDEHGASLLFYSVREPEMCKFLLDSGLDVDHVANDSGFDGLDESPGAMVQPLQAVYLPDAGMEPEELRRVIECRKLLLRAGADPTFAVDSADFLVLMNRGGEAESIQLAWNPEITAPFANISTYRDENGLSPFLALCHSYSYTKEHFRHFLRLGADLQDRDDYGRNCLCICFEWLHGFDTGLREFGAIEYLVQKGANICAVDNHRQSVCDIAYTTNGRRNIKWSYAGDLWDAILHRCGYDIPQFRSGYRRRARRSDLLRDEKDAESGSELDTEEDEEQASSNGADFMRCSSSLHMHEDEEQSESDIGEDMSTGDVESYWEETGTLPGFGELMQGVQSETWQDSPDLQRPIIGASRSLSMDIENPWL